ncbi:MAG: hypothetical protein QOE54_2789 [Streptosporangiaceae bacterium]|nr:hypothetical protein [Streptosporangiaceae bacterium]MDX6430423.1 hypothetical protein [Streptosporangiaceae bacterium]
MSVVVLVGNPRPGSRTHQAAVKDALELESTLATAGGLDSVLTEWAEQIVPAVRSAVTAGVAR